eukprot:CAMPEP_0167741870 /NCGR_PEP_ID=MMETSP0110_2-20121227/1099_1 /TAXON_ID=629695 /ORGANISM="Gymnochlora sp., Strain CCMP2014" /LENGTH=316 /DNA_ID=CAMNT_0007625975 /DNA_START=30 /DNA_END=980 /DNA_ORIENTATION=+
MSKAQSKSYSFETGHEEMIHDAQLDYYGKRLATASSDRTIKIFELNGSSQKLLSELKGGHNGPVWQVSWSHPTHGNLLASCSYDRKVCIWEEVQKNQWQRSYADEKHQASVNSVTWGPHEFGRIFAAASADGSVSVHKFIDNRWVRGVIPQAHQGGVNAVSWAPAIPSASLVAQGAIPKPQMRLVTGGCDNLVKIWAYNEGKDVWDLQQTLSKHKGWVRDVAWAPSLGLPGNTVASCSEDSTVVIWTDEKKGSMEVAHSIECKDKVWRVSWSTMGNVLAVSEGNSKVQLWKESVDGKWQNLSTMNEGLKKAEGKVQ